MKKKSMLVCFALILGAGLYIGSKSTQITSQDWHEMTLRSKNMIRRINGRDYKSCMTSLDDRMKRNTTPERMGEVFDPALDALGKFVRFKNFSIHKNHPALSHYDVCEVKCEYENGSATFTVFFDDQRRIGGVYLK